MATLSVPLRIQVKTLDLGFPFPILPSGWTALGFDDSAWITPVAPTGGGSPAIIRLLDGIRALPDLVFAQFGGDLMWPTTTPNNTFQNAAFRWRFNPGDGPFTGTEFLWREPGSIGTRLWAWLNESGPILVEVGTSNALFGGSGFTDNLIPNTTNILAAYSNTAGWGAGLPAFATFGFRLRSSTSFMGGWGDNAASEFPLGSWEIGCLGLGEGVGLIDVISPTELDGNVVFTDIHSTGEASIGLAADGTVYTWGDNEFGLLGTGSTDTSNHRTPAQVAGLSNITRVSIGSSAYALSSAGVLWGWGVNFHGELGLGDTVPHYTPVQLATNVASVDGSPTHAIILRLDGSVQTSGDNVRGQLGTGDVIARSSWTTVSPPAGTITDVRCGGVSSLVRYSDGSVQGVGQSNYGQLGNTNDINTSWVLLPLTAVSSLRAANTATFGLRSNGSLWVIGSNQFGILGINQSDDTYQTLTPVQVVLPVGVTVAQLGIGPGAPSAMARGSDGLAYMWGLSDDGERGDGLTGTVRTIAPYSGNGLSGVAWVGSGREQMFAYAGTVLPPPPSPIAASAWVAVIG